MSTSLVGFCKGIDQRKKGRRTYAEQLPGHAPVHACVECKSKNLPRARKASSSFARRRSAGNALAGPVATEYVEGATGKRRSWRGLRTTTEREREREREGGVRGRRGSLGDGWTAALSASAHHPQSKDQAWWPFCPVLSLSVVFTGGSLVFSPVQGYTSLGRREDVLLGSWPRAAGWDWTGAVTHYFTDHLSTQLSSWYIF